MPSNDSFKRRNSCGPTEKLTSACGISGQPALRERDPVVGLKKFEPSRVRGLTKPTVAQRLERAAALGTLPTLEPKIGYAAPVTWQILERGQAVELIHREMRNGSRLGQAKVDRQSPAAVPIGAQRPPASEATALRAEVNPYGLAADAGLGRPSDLDPWVFVVMGPQHAVTSADRTVACGGRLRHALEPPLERGAMTRAPDHVSLRTRVRGNTFFMA
jgi:hypothetical protein